MNPLTNNNNNDNNNNTQDEILSKSLTIRTPGILTPISPIQYFIQARSIEKTVFHIRGITKTVDVIGVKTIDKVVVEEGIFFGTIRIVHMDKSEILIGRILKKNAIDIKAFFEEVVEFQRKNVVNLTGD